MFATSILKESTKQYRHDGRTFLIRYRLESIQPESYLLRGYLKEELPEVNSPEAIYTVELEYPYRELGERLFDFIQNASDPLFPVHLQEIVHDQISCTLHDSIRFTSKTSSS